MFYVCRMGIVLQSDRCCKSATSHKSFGHSHGGHGHSHGGRGHSHRDRGHSHRGRAHFRNDDTLLPLDDESEEESTQHNVQHKRHKNINVRAAFIHVIGDIIQSLGVFTAALIIKCTVRRWHLFPCSTVSCRCYFDILHVVAGLYSRKVVITSLCIVNFQILLRLREKKTAFQLKSLMGNSWKVPPPTCQWYCTKDSNVTPKYSSSQLLLNSLYHNQKAGYILFHKIAKIHFMKSASCLAQFKINVLVSELVFSKSWRGLFDILKNTSL